MPITVGQDTSKTRKTLKIGDASIAYYSIPAATDAGLGDFTNLPAALKVVLENMFSSTTLSAAGKLVKSPRPASVAAGME